MWAQLANLLVEVKTYIPWVSFVAGVGGGLHCVGMCGGLVATSCDKSHDIFRYQVGRLLGYLLLGACAGLLAQLLQIDSLPYFSLVTAIMMGALFIYWGAQNYFGKKAEIPVPQLLSKVYVKLWVRLVQKNNHLSKSFFTGLISILLPCGLLYGVVLGTVALQNTGEALLSVFFFWLGTVPSMVMAPGIIHKLLRPIKAKLPKTYAICLMMIGVMTISFRIAGLQDHGPQRGPTQEARSTSAETSVKQCH